MDELVELAAPGACDRLFNLVREQVFIGFAPHVAEDADRLRELGLLHAREHEGDRRVFDVHVVDEAIVLVQSRLAPQLDDLGARTVHTDAVVAVLAEDHRLAVLKIEHALGAHRPLGEGLERAVVEDVAVLVDLDEADALVLGRRLDYRIETLHVDVDGAPDKGRLACYRQRERRDGVVDDAHRRRFRLLPELTRRRILPLRHTVAAVVEEDDIEVEVAPERVHEVVAADGETVAVARHDPHAQLRVGSLDAGADGRGAPVNRVEAVDVHVVGEARGAANPRDKDNLLARDAEVGHHLLDAVEDGVVATARTPTHLLVGGEVGFGELARRRRRLARRHRTRLALRRRPRARDVPAAALHTRLVRSLLDDLVTVVTVSVRAHLLNSSRMIPSALTFTGTLRPS